MTQRLIVCVQPLIPAIREIAVTLRRGKFEKMFRGIFGHYGVSTITLYGWDTIEPDKENKTTVTSVGCSVENG